jgi:hypothetical protein
VKLIRFTPLLIAVTFASLVLAPLVSAAIAASSPTDELDAATTAAKLAMVEHGLPISGRYLFGERRNDGYSFVVTVSPLGRRECEPYIGIKLNRHLQFTGFINGCGGG